MWNWLFQMKNPQLLCKPMEIVNQKRCLSPAYKIFHDDSINSLIQKKLHNVHGHLPEASEYWSRWQCQELLQLFQRHAGFYLPLLLNKRQKLFKCVRQCYSNQAFLNPSNCCCGEISLLKLDSIDVCINKQVGEQYKTMWPLKQICFSLDIKELCLL